MEKRYHALHSEAHPYTMTKNTRVHKVGAQMGTRY